MNNYVISLFLLLLAHAGSAQQEYLYTSNLEAYEGTWEYRSGNETFKLLIKSATLNTSLFRGSCLVGDYYHVKNGQVLNNYMANLPSTINDDNFDIPHCPPFLGDNGCARPNCVTPNNLDIYFWDRGYGNRSLAGRFTLLNSTTAYFEVWEMEDISGRKSGQISIPRNIVMYKVTATEPPPYLPPVDGEHNSSQY